MYRLPLFFGIALLILIVGLFAIFTGGSPKPKTPQSQLRPLSSYASTDALVIMTIDGVVNGDDAHRAIRITVGENERDLDIIQGYSGYVISHQSFYNTETAYNVFLNAINDYGFLLPLKKPTSPANPSGQCSEGYVYQFELQENGKDLSSLWASTCSPTIGTLGGDSPNLQNLFEEQITNYETLTENVNLG